ncbi:MAG: DUF1573 domain-containing protein [Ferruginibacter sp.]|nr:DUF1573 domain-containing protein [Ferruginibacter sp.]
MKLVKLFSLLALVLTFMSFTAKDNLPKSKFYSAYFNNSISWKTDVIDLGEIPVGKPVTIEFEFTNNSKAEVIVTDAKASCGCTVADYPKQPIAAGKTAKISATYNAATAGAFSKNVTVSFANEESKVLSFKGTVK